MFDSFSGAEILTIAVIALVVFGPGRLPEIARTLGGYLRELKAAVSDLRKGIEREIGPLREPVKEIKEDLTKPVSEIRRTLADTADTAKSVERDIRRSAQKPATPTEASGEGAASKTPQARWIAPEPPTGVSPSDVWEGMGDSMPSSVHPPPSEEDEPGADDEVTEQDGA